MVGGCKYRDDAVPFYHKFNVLKLCDMDNHETAKYFYDSRQNLLSSTFSKFFKKKHLNIKKRPTRSSDNVNNLRIPRYRTDCLQRSIKYQSVKVWNEIPPEIQNSSRQTFEVNLKKHYLQSYNPQ